MPIPVGGAGRSHRRRAQILDHRQSSGPGGPGGPDGPGGPPGEPLLFGKFGGTEIKVDGEDLMILRESDILGIIEKPKKKSK